MNVCTQDCTSAHKTVQVYTKLYNTHIYLDGILYKVLNNVNTYVSIVIFA